MRQRISLLGFCLTVTFNSFSQGLIKSYVEHKLETSPEKTAIDLFVRGDFAEVKKAVLTAEGNYKYGHGKYSSVTIPLKNLDSFLENPAITGARNGEVPMVKMCDTALVVNCVLPVHNGDAPLDTSYKGDGIIMGVIDYGIDFNHEDFKKSNGKTRIRWLWDQNVGGGTTPVPYGYGREWTEFQIDSGVCTHAEDVLNYAGHGTTVAGIAAGNGRACNGRYVGMAPNTDLIIVAVNQQAPYLVHFIDAADYIFKKADAMGKPCVINVSFGLYGGYHVGSHDGKDYASNILDMLLEERPGRVLVCAAGNAGDIPFHVGYDVTPDTSFTWFSYASTPSDVSFDFWADTQEFNNVYFAIGTDDPSTWENVATSQFYNIPNDYVFQNIQGDTLAFLNFDQRDSNLISVGSVATTIWLTEGRYNINIKINAPTPQSNYWSFITTGSGRIDGWNTSALSIDQWNMVGSIGLPNANVRPDIVNYKLPDFHTNMAASYACSDKIIAVGNFNNRATYRDIDSALVNTGAIPGMIGASSSHGPTRDGRIKPDISATGNFTLGSGHATQVAISSGNSDRYKVGYCGKYFRNGGTSMASPVVAGVAALYLQMHPTATWEDVMQAIVTTAKRDSFTGTDSNNTYGYGKVQACGAMLYNAIIGCMDSTADNYNPNATLDDGSCIYSDLNIAGVILSEQGIPIPGVNVALAGDDNQTDTTGSAGLYNFIVEQGGTYTVTPSKSNDVTTSNGVTTADILLIRRQILGIQPLTSPYKIIAAAKANAEGDSTVTTLDIIHTRSLILGNSTSYPTDRLWQFVSSDYVFPNASNPFPFPKTRTYPNITTNQSNQNFIGIKLGDVNGSWDAGVP